MEALFGNRRFTEDALRASKGHNGTENGRVRIELWAWKIWINDAGFIGNSDVLRAPGTYEARELISYAN